MTTTTTLEGINVLIELLGKPVGQNHLILSYLNSISHHLKSGLATLQIFRTLLILCWSENLFATQNLYMSDFLKIYICLPFLKIYICLHTLLPPNTS